MCKFEGWNLEHCWVFSGANLRIIPSGKNLEKPPRQSRWKNCTNVGSANSVKILWILKIIFCAHKIWQHENFLSNFGFDIAWYSRERASQSSFDMVNRTPSCPGFDLPRSTTQVKAFPWNTTCARLWTIELYGEDASKEQILMDTLANHGCEKDTETPGMSGGENAWDVHVRCNCAP